MQAGHLPPFQEMVRVCVCVCALAHVHVCIHGHSERGESRQRQIEKTGMWKQRDILEHRTHDRELWGDLAQPQS